MRRPANYLLIIGEAVALRWIVEERQMAFTPHRMGAAAKLKVGDRLLLFTTRGCFHNPTNHRSRVCGEATVASEVRSLDDEVEIAGRQFGAVCDLDLVTLAPWQEGAEFLPLVDRLSIFPDKKSWPVRLRQTLVALPAPDARKVRIALHRVVPEGSVATATYHEQDAA